MPSSLDIAIRTLLLPVKSGTGDEYGERAEEILGEIEVDEDKADWVRLEAGEWEKTGTPSELFRRFIAELLYSPGKEPVTYVIDPKILGNDEEQRDVLQSLSDRYFDLHSRIIDEEKVGHHAACRLLSHVSTMMVLATGGKMTASRIFSILDADGISLGKSWSTPRFILDACKLKQEASADDIAALYAADKESEAELLGDLSVDEAIRHVSDVCRSVGYDGDIYDQLATLFGEQGHTPYLCMLHFPLSILTLFNHSLPNGYEFSPRGEGVLWLTEKYNEAGLNVSKSPFLNNAKSVDTLNAGWASAKKKEQRNAARALTDILAELDRLSDPSRSAAGLYLRGLLHRVIRMSSEDADAISDRIPDFNEELAERLVASVGHGNTGTRGIIEQRLTDCVALLEAGDLDQWRRKGFGDSVFTTNTSQKKLGDAELKHTKEAKIIAVEAHGGRLTEKYVQDHLNTMRNVMPLRAEELEDRAALDKWQLELQFFAHELDDGMTTAIEVSGVPVNIVYRRYSDLAENNLNGLPAILNEHFRDELNRIHVHRDIRSKVIEMTQP